MSSRTVRKLLGGTDLPPANSSDDEFEPSCIKQSKSTNKFEALQIEAQLEYGSSNEDDEQYKESKHTNYKRSKKKSGRATKNSTHKTELDEVEKALLEVNALLGEPPEVLEKCKYSKEKELDIMAVERKHLVAMYENRRKFGSKVVEQVHRENCKLQKHKTCAHNLLKKKDLPMIFPRDNWPPIVSNGLSMEVLRRENSNTYFKFIHNRAYRQAHYEFLELLEDSDIAAVPEFLRKYPCHVHALVELASAYEDDEQLVEADDTLEFAIHYMLYVKNPLFNLCGKNTFMEYIYEENRVFHVALLKYVHRLTDQGCHRTALEFSKLLLNLDPSDPLAVILVIDLVAIRAKEYQWLIKIIEQWKETKNSEWLCNLQYSYALAHFLDIYKTPDVDFTLADKLLQNALIKFPTALNDLFKKFCISPEAKLKECTFFNKYAKDTTSNVLVEMVELYVELNYEKWRERPVREWLLRNAVEVVDLFENDEPTKIRAQAAANVRSDLYKEVPMPVLRHLVLLKMKRALVAAFAPRGTTVYKCVTNPVPPLNGINRYTISEELLRSRLNVVSTDFGNRLMLLMRSINPGFDYDLQEDRVNNE